MNLHSTIRVDVIPLDIYGPVIERTNAVVIDRIYFGLYAVIRTKFYRDGATK